MYCHGGGGGGEVTLGSFSSFFIASMLYMFRHDTDDMAKYYNIVLYVLCTPIFALDKLKQ